MGKMFSEVELAYISGLIDADGAIMALIERHSEKKFRFRVRIAIKLTQKEPKILKWIKSKLQLGYVRKNRTTYDWITRDQKEIQKLLILLCPFLKIKKKQAIIALKLLQIKIKTKKDLIKSANLADTLSSFNTRSRKRRKNFAAMIQEEISPND